MSDGELWRELKRMMMSTVRGLGWLWVPALLVTYAASVLLLGGMSRLL